MRRRSIFFVLLLCALPLTVVSQGRGVDFPVRLDNYFKDTVKLTAEEQQPLAGGRPMTRLLDSDESKEVAVLGAVWIARRSGDTSMPSRTSRASSGGRVRSEVQDGVLAALRSTKARLEGR